MVPQFRVTAYLQEMVSKNSPSDHETRYIGCHVGIHVDFTIHLAFTYFICRSLRRSVKQTWTSSAFSTNGSAWSVMVMGSQSRVWSGPITTVDDQWPDSFGVGNWHLVISCSKGTIIFPMTECRVLQWGWQPPNNVKKGRGGAHHAAGCVVEHHGPVLIQHPGPWTISLF